MNTERAQQIIRAALVYLQCNLEDVNQIREEDGNTLIYEDEVDDILEDIPKFYPHRRKNDA